MEARVHVVTLGVRDLARATAFYRDALGFPLSSASVEGEVAFLRMAGVVLALYGRGSLLGDANVPDEGGTAAITLGHNVRAREHVDAAMAAAEAAGARITQPAHDMPWGGYSGHFADPEGYLWEVVWAPMFEFASDGALVLPE